MLKFTRVLPLFILFSIFAHSAFAQLAPVRKFSADMLEGKTLHIPQFAVRDKFIKKMTRRGRGDEIKSAEEEVEAYNKKWRDAIEESSYDATPYSTDGYNLKQVKKEKQPDKMILEFFEDSKGNQTVRIIAAIPKWRIIARAPITGLSLNSKDDLKLIMNMLNESLSTALEFTDGKKVNMKEALKAYKTEVVSFYDGMGDLTLMVPKIWHKNPKKAANRNRNLAAAMKSWNVSKYKITTHKEIDRLRMENDPNSLYLLSVPYFTNNQMITYYFNFIISTKSDEILFINFQMKKLKPAAILKIQKDLGKKAEKYRSQLNK